MGRAAFEDVDCGFVVGVDDAGGAEGAEDLGYEVDGEFSPGEFAVDAGFGGLVGD